MGILPQSLSVLGSSSSRVGENPFYDLMTKIFRTKNNCVDETIDVLFTVCYNSFKTFYPIYQALFRDSVSL